MRFEIGQEIVVIDMFMTNFHKAKVVGVIDSKDLILEKDGKFSRGQTSFEVDNDGHIQFSVRATTWHESIDELVKHWTKVQKPSVQTLETVAAPTAPVGC